MGFFTSELINYIYSQILKSIKEEIYTVTGVLWCLTTQHPPDLLLCIMGITIQPSTSLHSLTVHQSADCLLLQTN